MPIYEYHCETCGKVTEVMARGFSGQDAPLCPACGQAMARLLTAPSLVKVSSSHPAKTCCGRDEKCETPSCAAGRGCRGG